MCSQGCALRTLDQGTFYFIDNSLFPWIDMTETKQEPGPPTPLRTGQEVTVPKKQKKGSVLAKTLEQAPKSENPPWSWLGIKSPGPFLSHVGPTREKDFNLHLRGDVTKILLL